MNENDLEKEKNKLHESPADLADAASEWEPDATVSDANILLETKPDATNADQDSNEASLSTNPEGGNDYVAFIETPFDIRSIEISEAQQKSEELELDPELRDIEDEEAIEATEMELEPEIEFAADDGQLDNLAKALAEQAEKLETEALATQASAIDRSAEELAAQIAEDQALNEQMAREAAEAEKLLEMDPELLAALPKEPTVDAQGNMDLSELQSCIETLLFMIDKPVSPKKLQELLGPNFKEEIFTKALEGLKERYQSPAHGIELVEIANGWQLRTKAGRAALAKKLAKVQTQRLSSGGMESLAIIAYRQPTMKEEIDKIRGVDSSYFIRGLLDKKLIAITGRSELPGRPMLYSTTDHFLELFGLKDLSSLPSLRELEQMVPASQSKNPDDPANEDPRIREMRRLVGKMKSDTSTTLLYDPKEDEKILTEIRERVKAIPTSTPYLDEQRAMEKAAKDAALRGDLPENQPVGAQLGLATGQASSNADSVPPSFSLEDQHPEMMDVPPPESIDEPEPSTDQV